MKLKQTIKQATQTLTLLAASLAGAIPAHAASITPSLWLLQITPNDLSTYEIGPDSYSNWFSGGYVNYLIFTAVPQHIVASWTLIPCPADLPCVPMSTAAPGSMQPQPEGPSQPGMPGTVPEPGTFILCGSLLAAGSWLNRRRNM